MISATTMHLSMHYGWRGLCIPSKIVHKRTIQETLFEGGRRLYAGAHTACPQVDWSCFPPSGICPTVSTQSDSRSRHLLTKPRSTWAPILMSLIGLLFTSRLDHYAVLPRTNPPSPNPNPNALPAGSSSHRNSNALKQPRSSTCFNSSCWNLHC